MRVPREIQAAVVMALIVLGIRIGDEVWRILLDSEASADRTFRLVWAAVVFGANALTALFIFFAALRRNWARIALLIWTFGAWLLWLFYPADLHRFAWWGWLVAVSVWVMECATLYLLFFGRGGGWYREQRGHAL